MSYTPRALLYKVLFPVARLYWSVFRRDISGVRCIIEHDGKLLLIRQTYGDMKWTLPGGMINRNELPKAAALRELEEEVGISIRELNSIGEFLANEGWLRDTVYCYSGSVAEPTLKIDRNEIYEAGWFAWNELPGERSGQAGKALRLYGDARRKTMFPVNGLQPSR